MTLRIMERGLWNVGHTTMVSAQYPPLRVAFGLK